MVCGHENKSLQKRTSLSKVWNLKQDYDDYQRVHSVTQDKKRRILKSLTPVDFERNVLLLKVVKNRQPLLNDEVKKFRLEKDRRVYKEHLCSVVSCNVFQIKHQTAREEKVLGEKQQPKSSTFCTFCQNNNLWYLPLENTFRKIISTLH